MNSSQDLPKQFPSSCSPPSSRALRDNLAIIVFVAAVFVSAALLFLVEPMFTKMVVPRLGGAAAVWSVAMVFFQTALLAGYAYAHLLTQAVPGRASLVAHLTVMLIACLALPLHIAAGWDRPPQAGEAFWLVGLFTVSIGLPFFALAANAPLLQAWFARTDHLGADNPYFLYAASNAGSFLALLSYPIAIEPSASLGTQTFFWSFGFFALIVLIAACGALLWRSPRPDVAAPIAEVAPPTGLDVVRWIALSAVPSGLLIAVTAHVSTDVAAVPLFWTVPLALYLLTFVLVFQSRPLIPHRFVVRWQPAFVLALALVVLLSPLQSTPILISVHLCVFFVCALMCHGRLARHRPPPRHLTAYFMWISLGGTLGGIATGLIAPDVFTGIVEYPLLLVLAVLCRPGLALPARGSGQYPLFVALGAVVLVLIAMKAFDLALDSSLQVLLIGILVGLSAQFWRTPLAFAAIVALLLFGGQSTSSYSSIYAVRNFFGVLNVTETADGRFRSLWHGTTGQGSQRLRDNAGSILTGRPEMISEFFAGGGIAQVFDALRERNGGPISFAVVGLGTGTLACQVKPGDRLSFFELDPDVAKIARDPRLFNYVSACAPDVRIVIGDARLTLADEPDGTYDLVFVDAFLGAAIPVHLMTREAMDLYLRKLKPGGIVALHISNKNLELGTVVTGVAHAGGLIPRIYDGGDMQNDGSEGRWVPRVAVVARKDDDFGNLAKSQFWPVHEVDPRQRVWTDDYSNVVGAIIRRLRDLREQ